MMPRAIDTFRSGFTSIKIEAWAPWLITAAVFLTYANSFSCPFLFDDAVVITNNSHIYHLWPPWKAVQSPARFLADYSFALNYFWAGNSPADFRLINILIHLAVSLTLFGIIRRTLLLPIWRNRYHSTAAVLAFAIALLWAVHPIQTESVTYIAQRIEALMGFFFLLTLACFIRGVSSPHPTPWYFATFIACVLGTGTKEVIVAAPPLILLYDAVFVAPSWKELIRKRWKIHMALFATWLILAVLVWLAVLRAQAENVSLFTSKSIRWEYALTQLNIVVHYLRLSIVPAPLCLDYYWPLIESPRDVIWPGSLTLLLGVSTLYGIWRRSWLGFLGAWVFIILAPTSSFNPLPDAAFEHRMYLPLAAVLTILVLGAYWMLETLQKATRLNATQFFVPLVILTSVAFGFLASHRNQAYQSEETMWRDVLKKRPDNFRPYISLSSALLNAERYPEAEVVCHDFLARCPNFSTMPMDTITNQFSRPNAPPLPSYYAMIHNNLGLITLNLNRPDEAIEHYREALRIIPIFGGARRNLGHAYFLANQVDDAISEWRIGLNYHPTDYKTLESLGVAYSHQRHFAAASTSFEAAITIKPDLWFSRSQLAWLLATCPDDQVRNGKKAMEIARPLLLATQNRSPRALDIIAAAHAEIGDYSNAIQYCDQALSLLSSNAHDQIAIRKRRDLYITNHPFHEMPQITLPLPP